MAFLATCRAGWELRCPQFPFSFHVCIPSFFLPFISSPWTRKVILDSHCPWEKKIHFLKRNSMAAQSVVLPLVLARAAVQPYLHPTTAREGNGLFFPSWQLLGRFTIVFWESSCSEAIVKTCSKQNFQPQDARNGIQGWRLLPRVDVTAAPFTGDGTALHPSCCL